MSALCVCGTEVVLLTECFQVVWKDARCRREAGTAVVITYPPFLFKLVGLFCISFILMRRFLDQNSESLSTSLPVCGQLPNSQWGG